MSLDIPIRIVLVEDDLTIVEGYTFLLNNDGSCEVINAYQSVESCLVELENDSPDVILLDIKLPGINGVDAVPIIKAKFPSVKIIMLTVFENKEMIFNALTNGASGYLSKNTSSQRILESIKEVHEGGGVMSTSVARMVIESFQKNPNTPLTKRETQILEMIAEGKSRPRIAEQLFIDLETVKTHIKNIYFKLNVHSREEAIKIAKDNKLI